MTDALTIALFVLFATLLTACAAENPVRAEIRPPERIKAWTDTLSVPHHSDPETGLIVADEVTGLWGVFVTGDAIEPALAQARRDGKRIILVATADRCAPCQQYKHDALNDARVAERLAQGDIVALHLEVDRQPELADALVGSRGIPMAYELGTGGPVRTLRGQRSADDPLAFLQ